MRLNPIPRLKLNKISGLPLTILYMAAILYLSVKPPASGLAPSRAEQLVHNLCHIPAYAILLYLLAHCFRVFDLVTQISTLSISILFGAFNEFLQSFVPGRTASWGDIVLNALGAGFMLIIMKKITRTPKPKDPRTPRP